MTDANKIRLKQLGWGDRKPPSYPRAREVYKAEKKVPELEVRVLRLEKELVDVRGWLERLAERYKARGYDARAIDKQVENIERALKA